LVAGGVSETTRDAVLQQFQAQSGQNPQAVRPVQAVARSLSPAQAAAAQAKQDQILAGLLLGLPSSSAASRRSKKEHHNANKTGDSSSATAR